MSESSREELVNQANELGLEFAPNVGNTKLSALIDNALNASSPRIQAQPKPVKVLTKRQKIMALKAAAFKTRIVTITNKDARESDVVTTAHLSFENSYFGLAKNVPLDMPVELEVSLIKIAKKAQMTLHKSEIKNGKPTGNKVPVRVDKYAVSYEDNE
jgi:hypothetical protein